MSDLKNFLDSLGCEDEHTEFKEAKNDFSITGSQDNRQCIYAYSVAIANEGGGCLVLGVDDNKHIVGTKFSSDKFVLVKEKIYKLTGQKIDIEEKFFDGLRVVVIYIPERPVGKYYTFYDTPLMRVGQQLLVMSQERQKEILSEGVVDWTGRISEKATLNDIDDEAVLKAKSGFCVKFPNIPKEEVDAWDKKTFLSKTRLLLGGKITNAALILLGKEETRSLLLPYVAEISWILKDNQGIVLDYEHFYQPLILSVDKVLAKIRNLKYRYMKSSDSLFPEEVYQYDTFVIREALNNCIAHQDYSKCAKITLVEKPDSLVFANEGSFIPRTIDAVISTDTPPKYYRNRFLADAMLSFNMIDTVGSGIQRMFNKQRLRLFPLPSYDLSGDKVKVEIFGKIIDFNYARILAENTSLSLSDIILLDNVQKKKNIEQDAVKRLRKLGYIEGRYPNIYISAMIAKKTGKIGEYLNTKGLDNRYYEQLICGYLEVRASSKKELELYLFPKLSNLLTDKQKKKKIENLLHRMSLKGMIECSSRSKNAIWDIKR